MPATTKEVNERLPLSTGRTCALVRVRNEWIPKYYLLSFPKSEGEPTPAEVAEMLALGMAKARELALDAVGDPEAFGILYSGYSVRREQGWHPSRWRALMERLRIGPNIDVFEKLRAAYAEGHRHYHTGEHIAHCLGELDAVRNLAREPDEVELALWFHDAVYVTRSSDNERKSAEWAAEFLRANAVDERRIERVCRLIMATTHAASAEDPDAGLLVDIDLSILGADRETYSRFECGVRKEYWWVPGPLFRRTRAKILESLLARESVYATAQFRDRLENTARLNLAKAIADLTQ